MEGAGPESHEVLIVANDDTWHPHFHVIANRVDRETGKASRRGEAYEREQGRIRCETRVKNNAREAGGRGGGSHPVGAVASLGALPPRGHGGPVERSGRRRRRARSRSMAG